MQRLAIQITGHSRNFEQNLDMWKLHIYDSLPDWKIDVYIHMWDVEGIKVPGPISTRDPNIPDIPPEFHGIYLDTPLSDFNKIYKTYSPVSMVVEPYTNELHNVFCKITAPWFIARDLECVREEVYNDSRLWAWHKSHRLTAQVSQYYKWYMCNQLRKQHELITGIKYDKVIRTRFDVTFLSNIGNAFADDSLSFPPGGSWFPTEELSDYSVVGTPDHINVLCDLYRNLDVVFEDAMLEGDISRCINPHKLYWWYLRRNNIPVRIAPNFYCEINRSSWGYETDPDTGVVKINPLLGPELPENYTFS